MEQFEAAPGITSESFRSEDGKTWDVDVVIEDLAQPVRISISCEIHQSNGIADTRALRRSAISLSSTLLQTWLQLRLDQDESTDG